MKKSVWSETKIKEFPTQEGDMKTDVLIIGGGMAGILCAYKLHLAGIDYILIEKDKIGNGITKNTTAKITSQHGLIYSDIVSSYGKEKAQMYLNANESAVKEYKDMCMSIDCDFEVTDAYTYSRKSRSIIENEVRIVNDLGFDVEFSEKIQLPFEVKGAVKFKDQAQFNPMKFIKAVSEDLNIYENTFARAIDNNTVLTDKGKIQAERIIVATHFPFLNKHGSYFLKLYQHRSYVIAYENAKQINGMYVDEDKKGMSFRNYKNLMLIGGGAHRTGKNGGKWEEIKNFAEKYYPLSKAKYMWATQDCMSLDNIPYIGHYSKNTPNVFVVSGFNKWGMTTSLVAANIISDMLKGKRNDYEELFSPQRSILKPQLAVNGFEAVVNLFTPTPRRCTHMGCALKWNKYEHTWDCPCHGSRFEQNGKLINNPAKKDADV